MTDPVEITDGRRRRGLARRAQLLATARELFAERGFQTTTTRELAAAAGVSDALLYRYFRSKDELLTAILDEGIARFQQLGPPAGFDPLLLPIHPRLAILGERFLAALTEQRDLLELLLGQHHDLAGDTRFVGFIDNAATSLGAELEQRAATGEIQLEPGEGYLTARAFMGAIVAFVLLQHTLGLDAVRKVDPAGYVANLARITTAGLTATPAPGAPA